MESRAPLKPAYLISGSDGPKVRRTLARLRRRAFEETASELNISAFDARLQRADEVLAAADTPTFTLGTRLLIVAAADRWPVSDRDRVAKYLDDPTPGVCLALVGDTFKKSERLSKVLEKGEDQVLRFDLPKRHELSDWVKKRGRAQGVRIGAREAEYLIEQLGGDPALLDIELAKLAAYAGGDPLTRDDIDAVCSPTIEARIFELTDAVGARDTKTAFRLLELLYASGGRSSADSARATRERSSADSARATRERSSGDVARSTLFSLVKYLGQLRALLDLPGDMPAPEVAGTLGVHPFTARKLVKQRGRFDVRSLERAIVALADAQAAMVGKAPFAPEFTLEMALGRLLGGH